MAKVYFQVCLDVWEKPCLLIGGGEEALEKAGRCLEGRAKLTIVSPRVLPELKTLIDKNQISYLARRFEAGDVKGMFFVVNSVKTDAKLSEAIYGACMSERCLIAAYDQPQWSNITMPYLVRSGKLRVAVSTNAGSPGIASRLGKEMERNFDQEFTDFVDWIVAYRKKLIADGMTAEERRILFRDILKDFKMDVSFSYPRAYFEATSSKKP